MNKTKLWRFISRSITPLLTVVSGVTVITLSQMNLIPENVVSSTVLGLLVLLATSEMVDKRSSLESITNKLEDINQEINDTIKGIKVVTFNNNKDLLEYLARRTIDSTISIDQASIDYRRTKSGNSREAYNKSRDRAISAEKIKYRYIGLLNDERRLDIAKKFLIDKKYENFFAAYYPKPETDFPLMNFVVFDKEEVLARFPYEHGKDAGYLVIKSKHVANLFLGYFESLWEGARAINCEEDYILLLNQFQK